MAPAVLAVLLGLSAGGGGAALVVRVARHARGVLIPIYYLSIAYYVSVCAPPPPFVDRTDGGRWPRRVSHSSHSYSLTLAHCTCSMQNTRAAHSAPALQHAHVHVHKCARACNVRAVRLPHQAAKSRVQGAQSRALERIALYALPSSTSTTRSSYLGIQWRILVLGVPCEAECFVYRTEYFLEARASASPRCTVYAGGAF